MDAEYHIENRWYKAEFIGNGSRLFRDFSVEVKKKINKKWSGVATFQNVIVDKGIVYGGPLEGLRTQYLYQQSHFGMLPHHSIFYLFSSSLQH